ncbi:unnamed protein product [Eruca vesicaria subsp. sativa]|uniref:Uncharacterized protein n=1 Tax=Eruca vesicaria subsp. sativa TaxID=29727 RepID=A0ABC8M6K6_ERUVS|nr:unnamed protein product [Eruca vesicaria subsp. sativa]
MTKVAGGIRNKGDHYMCCFYALCDLISSSAVLHGQLETYKPLSQIFIFRYADPADFAIRKKGHYCYECDFYTALKFAKESTSGIPLAYKYEMAGKFKCAIKWKIKSGELTFQIKEVYKYETLEQALERLKTHTVAASLLCYEGWDDEGLYSGLTEKACLEGIHEVIMLACV